MSFGGGASLGTAEGRITVDASQAISELGSVGAAMSSLDAKAGTVGTTMGTFKQSTVGLAQGMQNIGRVGIGLGAAIEAPFLLAAGAALDLESAMANVNAVMDLSGDQFQDLTDLAQQLGKDTVFSGTQAAQGIETLGKAGISAEDILGGAAEAATDLAAAGGIEVPRAAEVMSAAMQAFNISGGESIKVADALAGVANHTLSDVNQLGIGLGQVAGVANAAGMGLEETAGFIGLLADNGIHGSDAATSMKNAILSLLSPTDKATGLMNEMGVSLLDADHNFIGLAGASQEFFDAWKGSGQTMSEFLDPLNDVLGRDAVRTILFGMQAIEEGQLGINDGLQGYIDAASEAGAAQELANKRMDSTAGSIEKLKSSLSTLGENIGMPIIKGIRGPIDAITEFVNALTELPTAILAPIGVIGALAGALVALGGSVLLVGGYIFEAVARFGAAGVTLSSILGPALAVAAALAAIGVAVVAYQNNWLGFADAVNAVGDALKGVLGIVDDVAATQKRSPLDWHEDDAEQGAEKWTGVAKVINDVGNALSRSTIPALRDLGHWVNTVLVNRVAAAQDTWENLNRQGIAPLVAGIATAAALLKGTGLGDALEDLGNQARIFGDTFAAFRADPAVSQMGGLTQVLFGLGTAFNRVGLTDVGAGLIELAGNVETVTRAWTQLRSQGIDPVTSALYTAAIAADQFGLDNLSDGLVRAAEASKLFGSHFEGVRQGMLNAGFPEVAADIVAFGNALQFVTGIDITGFTNKLAGAINAADDAFARATREGVDPFHAALLGVDAALDMILSPDQQAQLDSWSQSWQNLNDTITSLGGEGLARVTQFFNELGTAMSTGDFSGAATAIQSMFNDIRNALGSFAREKLDWAINVGEPALMGWWEEQKGNVGAWIKGKMEGGLSLAGETLGNIQGWIVEVGEPQIRGWIEGGADLIRPQIQSLLNFAGEVLGRIAGWIVEVGEPQLQGWVQGGADLLGAKIQEGLQFAGQVLGTISGWVIDVGQPELMGAATNLSTIVGNEIKSKVDQIPRITEEFSDWVINVVAPTGTAGGIQLDAVAFATLIGDAITSAIGEAAGAFGDATLNPEFQGSVIEISDKIGLAIGEFIVGAVTGAVTNLPNIAKGLVGLNVTVANAVFSLMAGVFRGVFDTIGDVKDMATIMGPGEGGAGPTGAGSTIGGELATAIADMFNAIPEEISKQLKSLDLKIDGLDNPFDDILKTIQGWSEDLMDGLEQAGEDATARVEGATKALRDLPQKVMDSILGATSAATPAPGNAAGGGMIGEATTNGIATGEQVITSWGSGFQAGAGPALQGMKPIQGFEEAVQTLTPSPTTFGILGEAQGNAGGNAYGQAFGQNASNAIPMTIDDVMSQELGGGIDLVKAGLILPDSVDKGIAADAGGAEYSDTARTIKDGIVGAVQDAANASILAVPDVGTGTAASQMVGALDGALSTSMGGTTLPETQTAIGGLLGQATQAGIAEIGTVSDDATSGAAGAAGSIGTALDQVMSSSIQGVTLTAFAQAVGSKISESITLGLSQGDASAQPGLSAGVGGTSGIGATIANSLATSIAGADFAAVGTAIQSKISQAISAGMTTEAAPAGGGVAGGGAGIGASVATSLAMQITSADFSAVGAAISIKISEAVSLGMAGGGNTMGGPGERTGAGAGSGIGAAIVQSLVASVSSANFSEIGTTIKTQLESTISEALSGLGATISQQFAGVQSAVDGAVSGIQASMQAMVPAITSISAAVGGALQGMGSTVTAAFSSLQASIDASVSAIQASIQAIVPAIESISGAIQSAMATMTSTITNAFAEMQASVDSAVSGIQASVQAIVPALEGVAAAAGIAAGSIGDAIVAALDADAAAVSAAAARLGAAATVPINSAIEPGSPSKVVLPWAESIPEALVQGMKNGENDVKKAGVHLGKELIGTSIGKSIQSLVDSLKGGSLIADQLSSLGSDIGSIDGLENFGSSVMSIADEVSNANRDIGNNVKEMIANIRSKLKQGAKAVRGDAQSIGNAISSGASSGTGAAAASTTASKPEKPTKDAIKDAKELIGQLRDMKFNIDKLNSIGDDIGSIDGLENLGASVHGIADSLESDKDSAIDSAVNLKEGLKAEFRAQMKDYHEETRKIGKAVADGISEGIQSGTAAATESATGLGEDVAGGLNANLGRLPEMGEAMGADVGTGVSDGMNSTLPAVQGSGEAVGQALDTGLQNGGSGTTQTATDMVTDTTGAMSDAAAGQSDFSRTIGELISQNFGEGFASGANPAAGTQMVSNFGQGIRDAVNGLIPSVQQNGSQIGSALTSGVDQINPTQSGQKLVGEVGSGIQSGMTPTANQADTAGTQIGNSLTSGVESACGAANNAASDLTNSCIPQGINSGLKDATGVAQDAGQSVSNSLMNGLDIRKKDVERNFGNAGTGFTKAMGEGIGGSTGEAVNKAQGVAQAAGKVDGSAQGKSVGETIGQGIVQGVDSTIPAIRAAVEKAVQAGIDAAKEKSKSESPSKVFADIGSDFSLGLAMGIEDTLTPIANAARGMVDAATGVLGGSAFTDAERSMIASVGSYTSSLTDALDGAADKLTDTKFMRKLQGSQFNGGGDQRMRATKSGGTTSDGGFNLTINGMNINPNTPEGRALVDMAQILRQTTGQYANR